MMASGTTIATKVLGWPNDSTSPSCKGGGVQGLSSFSSISSTYELADITRYLTTALDTVEHVEVMARSTCQRQRNQDTAIVVHNYRLPLWQAVVRKTSISAIGHSICCAHPL